MFFSQSLFSAEKLNLIDNAQKAGISVYWDSMSRSGILEKNGKQLSFQIDQNIVLKDCKTLVLWDAPSVENGILVVSKQFMNNAESFFKTKQTDSEMYKIEAILIDPGHGGKDPGAQAVHTIDGKKVTVREKDITLSVGKYLYDMLKKEYPNKQILMTRDKDIFLSLSQRTEIANAVPLKENEAILYVSVHVNASLDKKAAGFETWYLSPNYRRQVIDSSKNVDKTILPILNAMTEEEYTTESVLIANFINEGLQNSIGSFTSSRGTKAEEWFVVKNSKMPAVLVEIGFLTNYKEACLLNDSSYLKKVANGIYNGLTSFVTHFEKSKGFTGVK
ncbi:MAG: N-acetylmuramoyl-L-alanine amidase [Spirochaetaceae bacterium]|nr:N-acetylmuramoyl-L-alanine amidase [Spirochaetaceae bacterium]